MSKRNNFKWRKSDEELLRRLTRNAQAKRNRLENSSNVEAFYIPDKFSLRDIKAGINSRADLNKAVKELKTFTARGGEYEYNNPFRTVNYNKRNVQRMEKAVNQFNNKIDRLVSKNPQIKNALPEKVTVKQLQRLIDTPEDLTRELKSLRGFLKKGAEKLVKPPAVKDNNIKITAWQKNEMEKRAAAASKVRAERKEKIQATPMKSGGQELGYTRGDIGMGKISEKSLEPIPAFTEGMNMRDIHKRNKHLMKESQSTYYPKREEMLRRNYIERGLKVNYDEDDIEEVIDAIYDMPFEEFFEIYEEEGGTMEFASVKPSKEDYEGYVNQLKSTWIKNK